MLNPDVGTIGATHERTGAALGFDLLLRADIKNKKLTIPVQTMAPQTYGLHTSVMIRRQALKETEALQTIEYDEDEEDNHDWECDDDGSGS